MDNNLTDRQRVKLLRVALMAARAHLVTLGGNPDPRLPGGATAPLGDLIQGAILGEIDRVLITTDINENI